MVKKFHAVDWWEHRGRPVANIKDNPYLPELWEPNDLRGETVEIDGRQYRVHGIETFCNMRTPDHPYKLMFSLAVDPESTRSC